MLWLPNDSRHMSRAMRLAMRGRGAVEPNPMVGCVLVREGSVIAEAYHRRYGGPHAEREALKACRVNPAGATAYITLEPCCHTEKKTPPCVPALIEARLARVAVGCIDPNPAVAGRGLERLRQAGIEAAAGLLEAECRQLNAAFFAGILHQRPYVTLKWAQSADGKVAGPDGRRRQISNDASMRAVHRLRGRCDAVLVGINTVLSDDPMLTARAEDAQRRPMRVVLDTHLRLPVESALVRTAREVPVVVYCSPAAGASAEAAKLRERGVEIVQQQEHDLSAVLRDLKWRGVTHVLVEPGPTLARSFIDANLADRAWIFQSPAVVGSSTAPSATGLDWPVAGELNLGGDRFVERLNPASAVFYHLSPSADLVGEQASGK